MMTKKDRIIANKQAMIDNRDKLIHDQQLKIESLKEENKQVEQLKADKEELNDLLETIIELATINTYGNEKAILGKIKELVSDYQSQN